MVAARMQLPGQLPSPVTPTLVAARAEEEEDAASLCADSTPSRWSPSPAEARGSAHFCKSENCRHLSSSKNACRSAGWVYFIFLHFSQGRSLIGPPRLLTHPSSPRITNARVLPQPVTGGRPINHRRSPRTFSRLLQGTPVMSRST